MGTRNKRFRSEQQDRPHQLSEPFDAVRGDGTDEYHLSTLINEVKAGVRPLVEQRSRTDRRRLP